MSDEQSTPSQEPNSPESPGSPEGAVTEPPAVRTRTRGSRTRKTAAEPAPPAEPAEPAEPTAAGDAAGADDPSENPEPAAKKAPAKRAAAKKAPAKKAAAKKAPAKRAAKKAVADAPLDVAADAVTPDGGAASGEVQATGAAESAVPDEPADQAPAPTVTRTTRARGTRRAAAKAVEPTTTDVVPPEAAPATGATPQPVEGATPEAATMPLFQAPEKKAPARRTRKRAAAAPTEAPTEAPAEASEAPAAESAVTETAETATVGPVVKRTRRSTRKVAAAPEVEPDEVGAVDLPDTEPATVADVEADEVPGGVVQTGEASAGATTDKDGDETDAVDDSAEDAADGGGRRRRRRGGRRRRRSGDDGDGADRPEAAGADAVADAGADAGAEDSSRGTQDTGPAETEAARESDEDAGDGSSRRRRRRRRGGESGGDADDSEQGRPRARRTRNAEDEITALAGSTRLEAKKQRRREGREAGRRRAPIVSEAEFLARRESVDRTMVIRQRDELTQIGVLEDKVLVEHYVARESQTSLIGNVYLGRVQNVLPSMEAAFIDIGKGRNAVLYAGEVNWSSLGHRDGQPRKIESVLTSGQSILVQVTKDPVGHKGARLSSQVSLAGRFLVYVPDGTTSGISRKLPDTERNRLKTLLKEIVPESAGVIVRTAAEGASEAELTQDVERLKARWEDIEAKARGNAPQLLYGEPDLTLKVVRDLFTEDFTRLVIQGDDAWETVQAYVEHVAPDLAPRLERYDVAEHTGTDLFATYRVDEQIAKGLDRKVWLPSGGSLVIDRTEAMTVVDVNTGKFTGSGGNLEETVTKNNLEAAEEIVRQLRLRDIGGIIVVDFIDMVLESNRDLVLRRLVECLGRDRTRHQVAEVTSLGLVQMTRKRIGTGLLEAFGQDCAACHGRGVIVHDHPVEQYGGDEDQRRGSGGSGPSRGRGRGGRGRGQDDGGGNGGGNGSGVRPASPPVPSPTFVASIARAENARSDNAEVVPLDERPSADPGPTDPGPTDPDTPGLSDAADPVAEVAAQVTAQVTPAVFPEVVPAQVVEPVPSAQPGGEPAGRPEETPSGSTEGSSDDARFPGTQPDDGSEPEPRPSAVVSRTRRRSATRPAGPPAGAVATVVSVDPAAAGDADSDVDGGEVPVVEKVPVKRRSTLKR